MIKPYSMHRYDEQLNLAGFGGGVAPPAQERLVCWIQPQFTTCSECLLSGRQNCGSMRRQSLQHMENETKGSAARAVCPPDLSAGVAALRVDFSDPSFAFAPGVGLRCAEGSAEGNPIP
jgi:hypothetical protein